MRSVAVVLIIAGVGLACAGQMNPSHPAQPSPTGSAQAVPNGVWGGEHIRIDVSDSGADIEFDCARGTIPQRLTLDAQGRFKFQGTYKAETPAPAAADGGASGSGVTATYTGVLSGSSLRLEVSIDGQDMPRIFELSQGDQGHLTKCA